MNALLKMNRHTEANEIKYNTNNRKIGIIHLLNTEWLRHVFCLWVRPNALSSSIMIRIG